MMRDILSRLDTPSHADDIRPGFLPADQLKAHVCYLCSAFGVKPEFFDGDPFQAGVNTCTREGRLPEIVGPVSYYIALHEIGHVAAPDARPTGPENVIDAEARAMQWACDIALVARSKEVDEAIEMALASYAEFPPPLPDSPFWTIMSPRKLLAGLKRNEAYQKRQQDEMLGGLMDLLGTPRRWIRAKVR